MLIAEHAKKNKAVPSLSEFIIINITIVIIIIIIILIIHCT